MIYFTFLQYLFLLLTPIHLPLGSETSYLTNKEDLAWLWHRRLRHASYNVLHKLESTQKALAELENKLNKFVKGKEALDLLVR